MLCDIRAPFEAGDLKLNLVSGSNVAQVRKLLRALVMIHYNVSTLAQAVGFGQLTQPDFAHINHNTARSSSGILSGAYAIRTLSDLIWSAWVYFSQLIN